MRRSDLGRRGEAGASVLGSLAEVVMIVGTAFILALLIQQFVVKPFYIPSESMEPTLQIGDRVLVNRFVYRFTEPKRGDVVVFRSPIQAGEDLIKRVVAVEGDKVAVRDGRLWVNGQKQEEPYVQGHVTGGSFQETVIPPGSFFAMGDNRGNSGDSRMFGSINEDEILGRAFAIYWPVGRLAGLGGGSTANASP